MGLDTSRRNATLAGVPLSYLSLATLAIQNAALILVMHYSRIMPLVNGQRYLASTAVFLNEALKFTISVVLAFLDARSTLGETASTTAICSSVYSQVFSPDSWKLAIPAALYTLQNSLQYLAVSNLDAATFQVTYQLKILTTAIFSVTMLRRTLTTKKWISLGLLMAGVAVVQLPSTTMSLGGGSSTQKDARALGQGEYEMSRMVGLIAVVVACAISGLAGVYFEKVLKDSSQVTLWTRNVQLSFWSLFPALFIGVIAKDGSEIVKNGFFAGYNGVVWTAIVFQAIGGLLVALVVNYADNIAKNFATSISIIISCVASVWLFDFVVTVNFMVGMLVVIYATYLYSSPDRRPAMASADPLHDEVVDREPNEMDVEAQDSTADESAPALLPQ